MTRIFALLVVVLLLPLTSGATVTKQRPLHPPNAAFFLANNDNVWEALQSYAEALCIQDKLTDHTPGALLVAGAQCGDSKRNADGDSLSHDGKWHDYVWLAYIKIVAICAIDEQMQNLCRWFRG